LGVQRGSSRCVPFFIRGVIRGVQRELSKENIASYFYRSEKERLAKRMSLSSQDGTSDTTQWNTPDASGVSKGTPLKHQVCSIFHGRVENCVFLSILSDLHEKGWLRLTRCCTDLFSQIGPIIFGIVVKNTCTIRHPIMFRHPL